MKTGTAMMEMIEPESPREPIPDSGSIEELAEFRDTHDVADYEGAGRMVQPINLDFRALPFGAGPRF